jgi:hypothetical protein
MPDPLRRDAMIAIDTNSKSVVPQSLVCYTAPSGSASDSLLSFVAPENPFDTRLKSLSKSWIPRSDGFQSVYGRVLTEDFSPRSKLASRLASRILRRAVARFQSLFFYCNESAFDDGRFRATVGLDANPRRSRAASTWSHWKQPRTLSIHARMFKNHGMTTIRF